MATLFPLRAAPSFTNMGESSQRLSAVFFNDVATFTPALVLPKNIGATTFTTDTFNIAGFNVFMGVIDVITANITFKVNIVDPRDQVTVLATRTVLLVVAGTGLTPLNFGFGTTAAAGGFDVNYYIQLAFTGAAANATINQFPGLWGCVR